MAILFTYGLVFPHVVGDRLGELKALVEGDRGRLLRLDEVPGIDLPDVVALVDSALLLLATSAVAWRPSPEGIARDPKLSHQ